MKMMTTLRVALSFLLTTGSLKFSDGRINKRRQTQEMPDGEYYSMAIIGADEFKSKYFEYTDCTRAMMVPKYGDASIHLETGYPFVVTDPNGFYEDGATFQLPDLTQNPPDSDPSMDDYYYSAWFRAYEGFKWWWCKYFDDDYEGCMNDDSATIGNCVVYEYPDEDDEIWCFLGNIMPEPEAASQTGVLPGAMNMMDLTNVCPGGDPIATFDDENEGALWELQNDGTFLMEIRLYIAEYTEMDPVMCPPPS